MNSSAFFFVVLSAVAGQPDGPSALNSRCVEAYGRADYATAEAYCRTSIAHWQTLDAALAPHLAVARVNLAQALAAQGRRAEARDEAQQAVVILNDNPGPKDPHTLAAVNLLAALDLNLGDIDAADALLATALPTERALAPNGLLLARSLHVLASVRVRQHRLDEALPLADEALRIAIRTAGDDSPDAALTYSTAAEVHLAAGRPDRALPLYRRARAIYEKRFSPDDLRVVPILTEEAVILMGDNQPTLARRQLERAMSILNRNCPACTVERAGVDAAVARTTRQSPSTALH